MATTRRASLPALLGLVLFVSPLLAQAPGASAPATAAAPRAMTVVDLISLPSISDPQLSPDGRVLVYTRSDADWSANRRVSHLWAADVATGRSRQLTFGERGESSPRFSPDGRTLAFLGRRGDAAAASTAGPGASAEETQIYLLPMDGGEARRLTRHATSVSDISWASDGSAIYFRAPEPRTAEQKQREKDRDDVYAFDENYQQLHLWRAAVLDGAERRITSGDYSVLAYEVARDGRRIVLQRSPTPLLGDGDQSEVWVTDADGGNAVELTHNRVTEEVAQLSPDDASVLFTCGCNAQFQTYYQSRIFVEPATGGEARVLFGDFPYEVGRAHWSKDGKSIYFLANMGVHDELFRGDVATGKVTQLTASGEHALGWSPALDAGQHVLAIDQRTNAGDFWLLAENGGEPRQVTHVYDDLASRFRLPRQEKVSWKGKDGVTVEGLLYYPLDYQEGKRYPLVVQTHGGPQASDQFGFGRWSSYTQVLTAMGYAVLKPNYRGSTGYGDAFMRDMVGHYYKNAHLDVLAGVDYLVQRGIADPDKLVAMGWSAGGHMTDKLITFTDRFKAASAGAGASNWISMYAQSDVRQYRTPWFGGTPWQKDAPIAAYWDNSPLKDVWKVKTPTLFLVGAADVRVPMPQSVEMYRALKSNGVPTHLYVAPREPHGWQELRHELYKVNIELDWFEKYAMGRSYTWEKAPGSAVGSSVSAASR